MPITSLYILCTAIMLLLILAIIISCVLLLRIRARNKACEQAVNAPMHATPLKQSDNDKEHEHVAAIKADIMKLSEQHMDQAVSLMRQWMQDKGEDCIK